MAKLSHYDERGASRMVDVSTKEPTLRTAKASGLVRMKPETLQLILDRGAAKGDVLETARLAAIMGAKRTGDLIPLCHPLGLDSVEVELSARPPDAVEITATVKFHGRTGVEMEAMTAVSVAGLTIYDMCKAIDRGLVIERVRLEEKSGGVRGPYHRGASDGIETT